MTLNARKLVLVLLAVCFLAPAEIKVAGVTVLDLLVYPAIGIFFLGWLLTGSRWRTVSRVERVLYLFLFVVIASSVYNSFFPFEQQKAFVGSLGLTIDFLFFRLTFYGVMTVLMVIAIYRLVSSSLRARADLERVVNGIIGCGAVNAFITTVYWLVTTGGTFDRYNYVPPIEGSQGIHLNYMSVVFLLSFALIVSGQVTKRRMTWLVVAMSLAGFSILTVMVRQGWVSLVLSLLIFVALIWGRLSHRWKKRAVMFSGAVAGVAAYFVLVKFRALLAEQFLELFSLAGSDSDQGSLLMRFALVQHGLEVFREHPILGVGFGHYPAYSAVPIFVSGAETFVSSPHNGVVTIAAETGIAGLLALAGLSYLLLREGVHAYRLSRDGYTNAVVAAVLSLLIVIIVSQFISNSLILPLPAERSVTQCSLIFWSLFGMVAAVRRAEYLDRTVAEANR